ncbi:HEAT repeat domain-containing protein [Actinomadura sp. 7K507]|uniref:HEAT repeat domain-containing protein n=1 Tax=Actinomadura sp. 7K507 TaxID=2530365 RepID=UPI0010540DC2|nr:HEAT repeat domain-containing protein [Actinomadura sp. 7K507]TDC93822.1 HEAT repeat domain-containing protein [Actinomadura sp. 7K507]
MPVAESQESSIPVQIGRLRSGIAGRPGRLREEPPGELLYQAVHGIGALDVDDPEPLVAELAGRADSVLRAEAFRIAREALHSALLAPARARTIFERLVRDVPEALGELAEPWAALDPLPPQRTRRLLEAGPAAAIEVAARHGHRDILTGVAADPGRPPVLRRRALELLGGLATREDVGELVAVAARDPLLLAGPAVACLAGMHRRGHFPAGRDVPAIVGLALADHRVPAGDLATVLYSRRHETLRELTAGEGDWPRRLDLLAALDEQGVPGLEIGDAVAEAACRSADPAPFLRTIRRLRHTAAEETVLRLLPRSPREALGALEAVGGARTVTVLRDGLGLDGGGIAPHLRPFRHQALELLWHLTGDAEARRAVLDRLDPRDVPPRIADDLGGPDPRELALLRANLDPEDPAGALRRLARNGDATTLPAIADLLLRVVSDEETPDLDEALTAVRELGGRLFRRGALRPRCLLDAADEAEAGDAVLADLVLGLLDRPGLGPAELTALLDVLRRAPYRRTRARVHPLLRHRDRHVRGRVIAVLAGDGGDARALSASLIPLTAAGDAQTVRQALLALAEARAAWAAPAIAACLDHPNMNVKKTAAVALAQAGAPEAVPKLLEWLGAHDNPGLREALTGALRAILGDAFAATVLAAADHAADPALLLRSLDGVLGARQAAVLARRGITVRAKEPSPVPEVDVLLDHGWDSGVARRVVDAYEREPRTPPYAPLRPMLVRWLDMAAFDPRAFKLITGICPPPWTDAELEVFARSAGVLTGGLAFPGVREWLLRLLLEVVPRAGPAGRLEVAERVRRLELGRPALVLLHLCGATPTRDDLDRVLAVAGRAEPPAREVESVLREAFGQEPVEGSAPLREELGREVRDADSLRRARTRTDAPSRDVLDALISVFPQAPADARDVLLDWMVELQPLGAPPWTLAERSRRRVPDARTPRPGDLDQPRSDAQRRRLLEMLGDAQAERRDTAARTLLGWPEPRTRLAVLGAYLHGRADLTVTRALARALDDAAPADLDGDDETIERFARLAVHLEPAALDRFVPTLLAAWERGGAAARDASAQALRGASPDVVAGAISGRLASGAWGFLDLVARRPLLRTPELDGVLQRLHGEGRDDLADTLILETGPLRDPGAAVQDEDTLKSLRERRTGSLGEPSRAELFRQARDGGPKQIRRALTTLAERHEEARADPDPELAELLAELIAHRETKVRLHAHRLSRRVLDRPGYLEQTARLLDDPEPDVVRAAIRTLGHAPWEPAIPGLVALLAHSREPVRAAAAAALVTIGAPAVPALRHAEGRARPDRRHRYTTVLEEIE